MAKYDMRIIAIATRLEKLQELARNIKYEDDIDIYPMKCDLRQTEDILNVFKWAFDTFNGIDVLVNNAAVAINQTFIGIFLAFRSSFFSFILHFLSPSGLLRSSLR
jgi:short-subunit dehydrogenase